MMNLKIPEKRSFFKIALNIVIIVAIGVICYNLLKTNVSKVEAEKDRIEQIQKQQEQILKEYKHKIDSLSEVNRTLEKEQRTITHKLDSITEVQKNISVAYEKEVDIINSASLSNHAEWFFSEIDRAKKDRILVSN